ncbi:MAG: helix-turn-helix domain-containing protein [bacterium]
MENKEFMTTKQVAEFLTLSIPYIKKLLRLKAIPAYKIGKRWVFEKNEILNWVESQKQKVATR